MYRFLYDVWGRYLLLSEMDMRFNGVMELEFQVVIIDRLVDYFA